jgi:hypothetical protein
MEGESEIDDTFPAQIVTDDDTELDVEPTPLPLDCLAERHGKLLDACKRAWPAMKFWGLSGARPDFVEAAMEIGEMIGEIEPQQNVDTAAILARGRAEGVAAALEQLKTSDEVRGAVGRRAQEAAAGALGRAMRG